MRRFRRRKLISPFRICEFFFFVRAVVLGVEIDFYDVRDLDSGLPLVNLFRLLGLLLGDTRLAASACVVVIVICSGFWGSE